MSHSVVMVIGDDYKGQLEPFDENQKAQPYWEPLGNWQINFLEQKGKLAPGATKNDQLKALQAWDSDSKYRLNGGTLEVVSTYPIDVDGPNGGIISGARWDWYSEGGRWGDFLLLKNGNRSDQASKGEVDWAGMRNKAITIAEETYNELELVTAGLTPPTPWNDLKEQFESIEDARTEYNENEFVKAVRKARMHPFLDDLHEYYFLSAQNPRLAYIQNAADHAFTTFALLYHGEWFERGKMGLFGIVDDSDDADSWARRQCELIENLADDEIITIVDVHI